MSVHCVDLIGSGAVSCHVLHAPCKLLYMAL